jgi:hypothetical protein
MDHPLAGWAQTSNEPVRNPEYRLVLNALESVLGSKRFRQPRFILEDIGDRTVSKVSKVLQRVICGTSDANIRFDDLCALLLHLGFVERVRGDHHIYTRDGVPDILNLQPRGSKAKAYQVKQVRGLIVAHGLAGEPESDLADDKTRTGESDRSAPNGGEDGQ